jgi:hypothetical protein
MVGAVKEDVLKDLVKMRVCQLIPLRWMVKLMNRTHRREYDRVWKRTWGLRMSNMRITSRGLWTSWRGLIGLNARL